MKNNSRVGSLKHIVPQYIAILMAIFLLATPALANNITDHREQVTGHVSPGTGINSSLGGQEPVPRTTAPVPGIETIARNNSGIPGVDPAVQAQTSSQPLLAGDINTEYHLMESNASGESGSQYWDIVNPGTYFLDTADVFSTNHNYAIRIFASDVIFNGNGKTITGPGIGDIESGPSYYGIRVKSEPYPDQPSINVTVKNVTVKNKYFGVKYEYVQGGEISGESIFSSNSTGICTRKSLNLNIWSNTVNSNINGIVLEPENSYFTIDSNNIHSNTEFGIYLSLSNNHNVISNNQLNYNKNMGIVLDGPGGSGTDNTISGNTVNGNGTGIYLKNYHGNSITSNSISGNTNVGVCLLESSSGNQFTGNYVQESGWVGILLGSSANVNVFYNNIFKNVDNEFFLDSTVLNNQWNINPPVAGVNNIIGGPNIGGNYWSNPSKNGFSDTHPDSNNDGFCDLAYNPQIGLIDNYPLAGDMNTVTYLDKSNVKGVSGSEYWDIVSPGTYILSADIDTSNNYAVRIYSSDVVFDGDGKTITGPAIGDLENGDSYYGIRVNRGDPNLPAERVTVKNVTVSNKHFGVIYEWVDGGEIRDSNFTLNGTGIYTWKSANLSILSNTVNSNTDGITLDANESTNDYFTIDSNNVHTNGNYGIVLWYSNNHNTITNNQVNGNYTGIALTDGGKWPLGSGSGTDNTVSGNTVNGNVNGIYVSNYNDNRINGNIVSGNSNAGIYLQYSSNRNIITNNQANDNMDTGIVLTGEESGLGGTGNTISNNTITRNANGIVLRNYHGNSMTGNSLSDNTNVGVWLRSSTGNQFTGNSVLSAETTGWWGMYLTESTNGNTFYNNIFKNSHALNPDENYGADETVTVTSNQWYTTPTPGLNIVGGPTIGGNYWGNASSTGFSDTHPDTNNDGFCDQPYNPYGKLIDQYPLHKMPVVNVTPGSLSFGSVPVGSTKDLTLTVMNTGSGALSGNAATAAPFSIVSGGSYSLGADQSQVVTIRYQPTSPGTHTGTVVFTGGSGATVPVTGKTSTGKTSAGMPWLMLLLGE